MHRYFCHPPDVIPSLQTATDKMAEVATYADAIQEELEALKGPTSPGIRARRMLLEEVAVDAESIRKKVGGEIKLLEGVRRCPHVDTLVHQAVQEADRSIVELMQACILAGTTD